MHPRAITKPISPYTPIKIQPTTMYLHQMAPFIPPQNHGRKHSRFKCIQSKQQRPNSRKILRLLEYPMHRTQHYTPHHQSHPNIQLDSYIFTNRRNNIFVINNHIRHRSSYHHHPDKLLIVAIVHPSIGLNKNSQTHQEYRRWKKPTP